MDRDDRVSVTTLKGLLPIGAMSDDHIQELASLCYIERISRTLDPFSIRKNEKCMTYLLRGELALTRQDGGAVVVVGGTAEARHPLGRKTPFVSARAITDLELIRLDDEHVDIVMTWAQLAEVETSTSSGAHTGASDGTATDDWRLMTGVFSVKNLRDGVMSRLPREHVDALLRRFERVRYRRGEAIVSEGADADFYYVIEEGRAQVSRRVGGVEMKIAQLKGGDTFGEEAMIGDGKRNATVTMLTEGSLLRLKKLDFNQFLKQPLLVEVDAQGARERIARGGQWIDVRYPSEYQFDRLPGALNIPLGEVRNAVNILDREREFVVYCQTGRRSTAAAFLLAQRGFRASVLSRGLGAFAEI